MGQWRCSRPKPGAICNGQPSSLRCNLISRNFHVVPRTVSAVAPYYRHGCPIHCGLPAYGNGDRTRRYNSWLGPRVLLPPLESTECVRSSAEGRHTFYCWGSVLKLKRRAPVREPAALLALRALGFDDYVAYHHEHMTKTPHFERLPQARSGKDISMEFFS